MAAKFDAFCKWCCCFFLAGERDLKNALLFAGGGVGTHSDSQSVGELLVVAGVWKSDRKQFS